MMSSPSTAKGPGLKVASIAGVPVFLGWSWFLLAAVITVMFGGQLAQRTSYGYLIGLGYAVFLLVAVLAHEGAHAVAARGFGITVHRVVADFLGGHTAFDARSLTAGRSAAIAIAGPLANGALALIGWVGLGLTSSDVVSLICTGLLWINLLLAAFNLLPGLPLDGGQLVEAAVWAATGRRSSGMIVAGWGGRVLTVVVAAWVLARPLLAGQSPSLVTVAWGLLLSSVIWRGGSNAIAVGRARRFTEGRTVGEVAVPVVLVLPTTPLGDIVDLRSSRVVLTHDPSLGLLWVSHPRERQDAPQQVPVTAVATRVPAGSLVEVGPEGELWSALAPLSSPGVERVLLVRDGQIWGALTAADVTEAVSRVA